MKKNLFSLSQNNNQFSMLLCDYIKSESSIQEYLPVKYSALALTFSMIKSKKTVRTD